MEPISLAASIVTLIGLMAKVIEKTKNFHDASLEFNALLNEVSDLQIVLNEFNTIFSERGEDIDEGRVKDIRKVLKSSQDALLELNTLINHRLAGSHDDCGNVKVSRFAWLRYKEGVTRLRSRLRNERNNLTFFLNSINSTGISRVRMAVEDISLTSRDIVTNQQIFQESVSQHLYQYEQMILQIMFQSSASNPQMTESDHNMDPGKQHPSITNEVSSTQEDHGDIKSMTNYTKPELEKESNNDVAAISVSYRGEACSDGYCSCACHLSNQARSPQLLNSFVGSLFIGYNGLPFFGNSCSLLTCDRKSKPRISVSYYFPRWFLDRALYLFMVSNSTSSPDLSLRSARIVSRSAEVFRCAMLGDIEGLKHLFKEGLASPLDTDYKGGYTALHYAADFKRVDCCQFLLQAGANAAFRANGQRSAGDFAWDKILSKSLDRKTEDAWRFMFDKATFVDYRQFSPIHEFVLGNVTGDLDTILNLSSLNVNDQDSNGRTALSWAASRGDPHIVRKLLENGANVNLADGSKKSPLQYAAAAGDPDCLRALLNNGANVNARNWRGRTSLHNAATCRNGVSCLALLLSAGADVNVREYSECETPIIWACDRDFAENVGFLLSHGASLEIEGSNNTPLRMAVFSKAHETLPLLLRKDQNYQRLYTNGETILHIAASKADHRIFDILASESPLPGLGPEATDNDGNTAFQILKSRFDLTPALVQSFQRLLQKHESEKSDLAAQCEDIDCGTAEDSPVLKFKVL